VDVDKLISDKDFWATTKVCVMVLLPAPDLKVLRFSDGIRGGNLGLMYNLLLQLDEFYSSRIDGLPEKVRTKVMNVSCDNKGIRLFFFIFGLQHYFYFYLPHFCFTLIFRTSADR
jgi:hypothetical protein